MKTKIYLFSLALFVFQMGLLAQSFSFSYGAYADFNRVVYKPVGQDAIKYTKSSDVGIVLAPRVNLFDYDDIATLSLGSRIGLGVNTEKADMRFQFHAPVLVGINFGNASSPYARSSTGGFVEVGYEFSRIIGNNPMISRDGIRYDVGIRLSYFELSFHQIFIDDKINAFGVSLLYNYR